MRYGNLRRLEEMERRLRAVERTTDAVRAGIAQAKTGNKAQAAKPAPWTGGGGGGGSGPSAVFRWATQYCFKVIFDTAPEFSTNGSLNTTADEDAFDFAVSLLEEPHPLACHLPWWLIDEDPPVGSLIPVIQIQNEQFWPGSGPHWHYFSGANAYGVGDPRIRQIGFWFSCGYFPESTSIEVFLNSTDDDELVSVSDKYVPCVKPRDQYDDVLANYDDVIGTIPYEDGVPLDMAGSYSLTLAKFVDYAFYDAAGIRRGWRRLFYKRRIHDATTAIITPYIFGYGPKFGTTGAYQFEAVPAYGTVQGPSQGGDLSAVPGVGDVYVSWGADCSEFVPPVNGGPEDDWEDFCAAITAASATFVKIPGLTIKFNGTTITSNVLGNYVDPPTITFEFSDRLQEYLEENPDVFIVYRFTRICDPPPANPTYGAGPVVDGGAVIIDRNPTCDGLGKDTEVLLDIKMEASPSRDLFDDICCTPYASHCSVQSISADQISFLIDPS